MFFPCQAILLHLNHSVHLHPPSSEYFKKVKWKCKQTTSGTAQQKPHCQSALFTKGKAQLFYLLAHQFIYLFVWLNLLWDEGKDSRVHGREELSLRMSDQSAGVTLREYFLNHLICPSFVLIPYFLPRFSPSTLFIYWVRSFFFLMCPRK